MNAAAAVIDAAAASLRQTVHQRDDVCFFFVSRRKRRGAQKVCCQSWSAGTLLPSVFVVHVLAAILCRRMLVRKDHNESFCRAAVNEDENRQILAAAPRRMDRRVGENLFV